MAYYDPGQNPGMEQPDDDAAAGNYLLSTNAVYDALDGRLRAVPNGGIRLVRDDANDRVDFDIVHQDVVKVVANQAAAIADGDRAGVLYLWN